MHRAKTFKNLKRLLSLAIILLTAAVFVWYWQTHPELWQQLRTTSLLTIFLVLALYGVMLVVLVWIYDTTLRLCRSAIGLKEQTLLTMYSSIVNFFGPLQSGPGFRAVYLKQRHGLRIRTYAGMTFLYYGWFALFSGLFLLSGGRAWWQNLALLVLLGVTGLAVVYRLKKTALTRLLTSNLSFRLVAWLGLATLVQVFVVSVIYFTELTSIDPTITFHQAIIYTGAANFSLFVSLTPGALGFREAFLFFSQNLHHIDNSTIVAANVIDRTVYLVFLGMLFLAVLMMHAQDKLRVKPSA